jgi:RNA polymerase sigma-70 factor, ECF subfamily
VGTHSDGFQLAFTNHHQAVYRFAWRLTGSHTAAEDLTQECFLQLLAHPARFQAARGALRPFLFGITRNLALKHYRSNARLAPLEDSTEAATPPNTTETAALIGAAILSLPLLQRETLILIEYEGQTLEEAAAICGVEVGAIKSRLHRARQTLRHLLAPLKPKSAHEIRIQG